MKLSRKISVVAATFLLAAATGQYIQSNAHRGAQDAVAKPAPLRSAALGLPDKVTPLSASNSTVPDVSATALRSAMPKMPTLSPALPAALSAAPAVGKQGAQALQAASCHATASVTVDQGAILNLKLDAPCHADQRVVIRHGGLAFTELTDPRGALEVKLPAMTEQAKVTVMFPGDSTVSASTLVPELSLYDRVAVQWMGNDSFDLHALEFGAQFGDQGDISAKNPGTPAPTTEATEGFLMSLGSDKVSLPMKAQVYTFPTRLSAQDGKIKMVIDADVSADTCGRDMLAETLRTQKDADPTITDLSVAMPACDAPGGDSGFVQLSGLVPDIKVAGN